MADLADDQTGEMESAGYPKPDDMPPKYISFSTPSGPNMWVRDRFISGPEMRLPKFIRGSYSGDPELWDTSEEWRHDSASVNAFLSGHLLLGEAFKIAVEVHGAQLDKSGEPYLFHVMRVAMSFDDDGERCVAILHDAVEDTPGDMMSADGSYLPTPKVVLLDRIRNLYGLDIAIAVCLLTHERRVPYMQYIQALGSSPLARAVKLADLADNMSEPRLRKLPMHEADRLRKKYREAWDYLMGIVR